MNPQDVWVSHRARQATDLSQAIVVEPTHFPPPEFHGGRYRGRHECGDKRACDPDDREGTREGNHLETTAATNTAATAPISTASVRMRRVRGSTLLSLGSAPYLSAEES